MSGRKYSMVELANNVKEAIGCKLAMQEAFSRANSMVTALVEAARTTPQLKNSVQEAKATLEEVRKQMESMDALFNESNLMQLRLDQVQAERKKVDEIRSRLEKTIQKCRLGNQAAAVRVEVAALLAELETNRSELHHWLRDTFDHFFEQTRLIADQADEEIKKTGGVEVIAKNVDEQIAGYQAMLEKVSERRTLDAERRYIANALEKVCKEDMGFDAKLLPQSNPLEDLVLEVNTFAYGIIHFRLELDGTIRSLSDMVESSCCANYKEIEDSLRSLGVISAFRYEGDQRPVRLKKGEDPLPYPDPAVVIKGDL